MFHWQCYFLFISLMYLQKKNIDVDDDDDEFNHEIDYEESTYEEGLL